MSVEDTDFSPPATAVMFLLTIHPTALEAGDFLSTGVKFRHAPEAFPYYRLFFSAWQAVPETGKARRFLFSHLPAGFGDFCILFFHPGSSQSSCSAARFATIRATWAISGIFVYSAQLCTWFIDVAMTRPSMPCWAKTLLSLPPKVFSNAAVRPSSATALS